MKNISIILLVFLASFQSFSQTIKGKVADDKGMPIPGANVTNTNGLSSASSDFDGNFIINAKAGDKLKISMIGYSAVTVAASQDMTVKLKEETTTLQDVVVVGYGTRKAIDATMAVTKIKAEEISKQKVLNPIQGAQGKMAGVTVVGNDRPGESPNIIIRGVGSFIDAGGQPLYVVDGMFQSNINNLSPNSIESFEIIKDASALAIYGNLGTNGVVIITTKKGKGTINVSFDNYFGVRTPLKIVKMAGSNLYAKYNNLARGTVFFSQDQPYNTNWIKETIQTGTYSNSDLSISGSNEYHSYNFNTNHYSENSILPGSEYKRTTFRLSDEYKMTSKLKLNGVFNIGFTNNTPKNNGPFTSAYKQAPIVPVYYEDGKYGQSYLGTNGLVAQSGTDFNYIGNPVQQLDFQDELIRNINLSFNFGLDYKITNNLKYKAFFGAEYNNYNQTIFNDFYKGYFEDRPSETDYPTDKDYNELKNTRTSVNNYNFSNYLTYNFKVGNAHDIELMAGLESIKSGGEEKLEGVRYDIERGYYQSNFSNNSEKQFANITKRNDKKQTSYFSRIQYKLLDRYLLSANIRRDGTSQYALEKRWGVFPAFGLGWVISKESFLANNKFINHLKIRGGWGVIGNQNVDRVVQVFSFESSGYSFGEAPQSYVTNSQKIDPSVTWEETREASGGIEFELLNNRFKGSFDYYEKLGKNIILDLSSTTAEGTDKTIRKHAGAISNKGFEVGLNWNDKVGENWKYGVGLVYSNNKNELVEASSDVKSQFTKDLGNGPNGGIKYFGTKAVGQPIGSYYLYEYAGLNENGRMLYYTRDGRKVLQSELSTNDRKFFGSAIPKANLGLNFSVSYKQFDLGITTYAAFGAKIFNAKKAQRLGDENIELSVAEDFWTPENPNATNPAPINEIPYASTYYLESGDFFRVNNINLTYNLPSITKFITGGAVYINLINPFISQKFSGFSPEISGSPTGDMGVESDAFPTLRSMACGVKLNF